MRPCQAQLLLLTAHATHVLGLLGVASAPAGNTASAATGRGGLGISVF